MKTHRLTFLLLFLASCAFAECKLTVSTRKVDAAERTVVTLENERILVEVVPDLEGRIIRFMDKSRPKSPFEWLDDCPYHYGARWEGKPFTYHIDARGPDRAAVTVLGGGKIAVSLLRAVTGIGVTAPIDLRVERTMSIEPNSTRLRIDMKVTNAGDGVAPRMRYMVHAVFGQVPPMPEGLAAWFLPVAGAVEFFDAARGHREMGESAGMGGAPLDHPFSRFTPGTKADKPRYFPGGWAALLTSAGPAFIYYDPAQFDFMQYWFGGDAEWHFTFEPHTKPVDLKPGESTAFSFTLAFDPKDVPFAGPTVAYQRPAVPTELTPGSPFRIAARATTVRGHAEQAKVAIQVKDPKGTVLLSQDVAGEVQPFAFTELAAEGKLPADATLGKYVWTARADGKELASGQIDVVTPANLEKLRTERTTAALRKQYETTIKELREKADESRRVAQLWKDGVNLALTLDDRGVWPDGPPPGGVSVQLRRAITPVLGLWRAREAPRIKAITPAPSPAWPADPEKLLAALRGDRAFVRDAVPDPSGKGLIVLIVDAARRRAQIVEIGEGGIGRRFGRFADRPTDSDDAIGPDARALAVDREGNIWVTTNAWGPTSVFQRGADGAPFEQGVVGAKGALKKFSPDGRLLGAVSLLDAPIDLALAVADGVPILLVSYRSVSEYHGAQVREGIMLVRIADAAWIGEIKTPGGSICIDEAGRIWVADLAGHVACYTHKGRKLLDVAASPAPAVPDARLPAGSPAPVVLRADGHGALHALFTLGRKLQSFDTAGAPRGEAKRIPDSAGGLYRLAITPAGPVALADKALWRP